MINSPEPRELTNGSARNPLGLWTNDSKVCESLRLVGEER